ncbi:MULTISPECIES: DUF6896 domain-containing protein [Klebsiella]|uniref:DUF6896 domain-containing protein n=1 Tax=Klebsiella TaxID=570 RepID=UPI000C29BA17|nr:MULTISPECIES: hypothetical protein [Klebsiella]PJX60654.1 hypothetical protein CWM63_03540 [Klebsiella sp. F-Nf9]PKJ68652.1 hypothetical protein CW267_21270 [Klebsiella sp. X1-16S-Nf21]QGG22018.1 hypothetical protein GFC07_01980 [Klebsiella variicola]GKO66481.1 hypothetical protein MS6016_41980 [Klebsiella variicola]
MNNNLYRLIVDFQDNVQVALKLMHRSGIKMPSSCYEWIESDIPNVGELDGGVKYYKHGAGCRVDLNSGSVDFDFGGRGEVGGFNSWWLTNFAGENLMDYGFRNFDDVSDHLKKALDDGELIFPDHDLYYFANVPHTYAIDTDCRFPEDRLPCRNHDRVLTLQIHYFETADLMFKNYNKLNKKMTKNGHLSEREKFDMGIYLSTWLGFLSVVYEGFKSLNMRLLLDNERPREFKELLPISDDIGKLMKEHSNSLRIFRNNVFHLRESTGFIHHFFDKEVERLPWAGELHIALSHFFSQYRIFCEVHYVINERKGESNMIKKKVTRPKKVALRY